MRHASKIFLVGACVVAIECRNEKPNTVPARNALALVSSYSGRDLSELGKSERKTLETALRVLDPNRDDPNIFGLTPLYIWEFPDPKSELPSWLVLERSRGELHPGTSTVRLMLVNASGEVRANTEFGTGHRCYLGDVRLERLQGGLPVVALNTGGCGLGPDFARQYYAQIGDRFELIRVEGDDGTATRNRYYVNHFYCGPEPPKQTEEKWAADLCGPDHARVLRALVWIGGVHRFLIAGEPGNIQFEDPQEAQLARRVRARPDVTAELRKLVTGGNSWEREAAELALQPDDTKW